MTKPLKLYHFLIIYPSLWLAYCLFEFISGNIKGVYSIVMNFIPAFLLLIISYIFFIYHKKSIILKNKGMLISICVLFLIDQLSKIIVSLIFINKRISSINLIPNYLSITPHINDEGSFIASRFNLNAPFILFIILNFLILVFIFLIYRFKIYKKQLNSIKQLTFIFLFSGGLCSLIDKIFWGGSLDFLHIHNLFIADIKDIFITFGLGSFILSSIISDDDFKFSEFLKFIFKK